MSSNLASTPFDKIRNFSVIAHIDHGKTTLSDRLISMCEGLSEREMHAQVLDSMDLERERGITIKAQCVTLFYQSQDGGRYRLNLIDTPGHVDFSYEVSRSLSACEGALLVVDASQGVEAQSVANCYQAIDLNLEVVPVLNKIDLPAADPQRVKEEIADVIGIDASSALEVSAKTGLGVLEMVEALIAQTPPPQGNREGALVALIVDSWFDSYLGVVILVRVKEGVLRPGDRIRVHSTDKVHQVDEVGIFTPKRVPLEGLSAGEVGYVVAAIREIKGAPVGDTLLAEKDRQTPALPGFRKVQPMVYAGLFPVDASDYGAFRESLEKLTLNDSSLSFEPENADALGQGFRCGFLGLLHMEIVQERLEREYRLNLITTTPTVVYECVLKNGESLKTSKPSDFPDRSVIDHIKEPIALVNLLMPQEYVGRLIELCTERRGIQKNMAYIGRSVSMTYEIPLSEVVVDFFDAVKSASRGYASFDFTFLALRQDDLVKVDILVGGEKVEALSFVAHREESRGRGLAVIERLKDLIPRQMFEIAIQAAIGGKIIGRTNVKAFKKNVIAKCYGGDVSRKRKLLEKQKEGKKRMKMVGNIELPQEAFLAVMARDKPSKV